jgi:ribonuclease BN (tRNA processing enzyme)
MNAYDIETRIADEGRIPLVPLVFPHEITSARTMVETDRLKVTAALADHPPVSPAFAYRFDCPDRSIVFSGDTRRSDEVVRLARDADVLVHEAMYPAGVERLAARVPGGGAVLKKSILAHHTSAQDAGRVAAAAGVKTLVLSHLVPADDPTITDSMWIDAARHSFGGTILVARDGMEL